MGQAVSEAVYNFVFRDGAYSPPTIFYLALVDADNDVELTAAEYARVQYTPPAETYPGQSWNPTAITFPTPLTNWGWISELHIYNVALAGTLWMSNFFGVGASENIWEGNWIDSAATINLLIASTPSNGDTLEIDGITYTFVSVLADPYDVLISGSSNSLRNLANAINDDDAHEGSRYGIGTAAHPNVTAVDWPWGGLSYTRADGYTGAAFIHLQYTGADSDDVSITAPRTGMFLGTRFGGAGEPLVIPVDGLHITVYNANQGNIYGPFQTRLYNWLWRASAYINPRPYAALFTTMPDADGTGGVEVVGASYARQDLDAGGTPTMSLPTWTTYVTGTNASAIDWGVLGENWGNIKGMVLIDNNNDEAMLGFDFTPFDANAGDSIEILVDDFTVKMAVG